MTNEEIDVIWEAWSILNAISARDGAPDGMSEEWFSTVVVRLANVLPPEFRKPWAPVYVRRAIARGKEVL